MEIPVINRLSDFEAGMNSLQIPSFLSQIVTFTGIENLLQAYSFWKWGALILALLASFTTLVNRIRILIIRFRFQANQSLPTKPLIEDDDYDSESDSSCSSSDDEEDEPAASPSSPRWRPTEYLDFRVSGSAHSIDDRWKNSDLKLRRRRSSCSLGDLLSFSELANKKSVVKLWDNLSNLGLGLDLNRNSFGDEIDTAGLDIASIFGWNSRISAVPASSSPAVVVSASTNESKNVELKVWDTRAAFQLPAIIAEWRPTLGKIVGVYTGGVDKVYVRDDGSGDLTVGDMRKASSPLENLTESDSETWWDADAGDETIEDLVRTERW
ncbi:hypothetical protein HS088_TW07G00840 [Tripterygium wilfordii]|uniref:Uncharacterized protein n=1 Tax=Tripterygium wilfordii TaxID=458696 RepID=A0A7J7DFW1_TRIWF|nr:uncharacterized protein LOC120001265 [Tripterygium wilfordii]KAF5745257.1 hypothetical protein HS088_TW07G00840 [Tripterygium wilfordii]